MNANELISYNGYLLDLLDNNSTKYDYSNEFKLNLYITLLSLNNSNYHESIYLEEINTLEDFLRKVNNLKVKIQLKRKEIEIDELISVISAIYNSNQVIIDKYNKEHIDITSILDSKDPKELTTLIDKLTKEKMIAIDNKEHDDIKRNLISYSILNNRYRLKDNTIYIESENQIEISLDEFFRIFEYLLYIKNYPKIYSNEETNNMHISLITNIIDYLNTEILNDNNIIPIILTYIVLNDIPNYEMIDTSYFNIENIKITDLYSLANHKKDNENTAKWKNIYIPNSYLYQRIKEMTLNGNYYFKDNNFILDNIVNFKITISIDNMKEFLRANLNNL